MGNLVHRLYEKGSRLIGDEADRILISHRRKTEVRKYQSQALKSVYERVQLTDAQKRETDSFYLKNYGERIPYTWHQYYTAFTGHFDPQYFPELLYIPEFEHFMNIYTDYASVFSDKNVIPIIAASAGVDAPRTILSSKKGAITDSRGRILSKSEAIVALQNIGEAFIKPSVDSNSGHGCALVAFADGFDKKSLLPIREVLEPLGRDFVIQEKIICDKELSEIYPHSVNTFRIMTYRWRNEIRVCPATMRCGRGGSYLDNIHAGGLCIAINEDGTLHSSAFSEIGERFREHPDTGVVFDGYRISNFPKVIAAAIKLHCAIPQIGVVHWDFTINDLGNPVLIEGNMFGTSIQLIQRPLGRSAFGDDTAEILQWMRIMKKTKKSDWEEHAFGKM